jgi:pimeloyl-ACP methyl ester carboxylesterase
VDLVLRAYRNGSIFGTTYGDAPPAVLGLPGWTRTARDFDRVFAGLDAVALDLPGFGASPPPPETWGSPEYAAAVAPVIEEISAHHGTANQRTANHSAANQSSPASLVVVGHSFGGRVAVHLAAARPDLVRALVLTGVPLLRSPSATPRHRPALAYRFGRVLHRTSLVSDNGMERLRQRYGSRDYAAASGVMRDVVVRVVNETYEASIRAITCPVELAWGELDDVAPPAVAEAAAAVWPSATVSFCTGAGHLTLTSAPDCIRAAIDRCLQLT